MIYRADYLNIHDNRYKKLRSQNKPGWDGDETPIFLGESLCIIEKAISKYNIKIPSKLLELGCGNGCLTIALNKIGFECWGIDIAPSAIDWAKEIAKKEKRDIDYTIGNVLNLPYPDNFFDIAIDGHCFHCIIDNDRKSFLNEAYRVLKPDGIFIIMTMCSEPSKGILKKFECQKGNLIAKGIAGRYIGKPEDILNEIRHSGLQILEWSVDQPKDGKDHQDMLMVIAKKEKCKT